MFTINAAGSCLTLFSMDVALNRAGSKYAWLRSSKEQGVARLATMSAFKVEDNLYHRIISMPFVVDESISPGNIDVMVGLQKVGELINLLVPMGFDNVD